MKNQADKDYIHPNFLEYIGNFGLGMDFIKVLRAYFKRNQRVNWRVEAFVAKHGFYSFEESDLHFGENFVNRDLNLIIKRAYHTGFVDIPEQFVLPFANLSHPSNELYAYGEYEIWRIQVFSEYGDLYSRSGADLIEWSRALKIADNICDRILTEMEKRGTLTECSEDSLDIAPRNVTKFAGRYKVFDW